MRTLEKIRDEIEQIKPYELPWDKRTPEHIKDMALEIIDKYAEQEPKTGRWIDVDGLWFKCSKCDAHRKMCSGWKEHFCPNCGVKMVEPQESKERSENNG